ncbi:MAG: hypothetical protein MZV65_44940 [Chromatiales bacterium]|nr:hypothetical protein [Chromatiales bacterium]
MAGADRAAGPLRRRLRQRRRRRPPRHRHAARPGCMNPNHYLAVAIDYLLRPPPAAGRADAGDRQDARVSSSLIDRVAARPRPPARRGAGRLQVVRRRARSTAPSASAARRAPAPRFLRRDGTAWTTDKDGIILGLLAAEITAGHRTRPGRALPRARRRRSARRSTRASTPRPRRRRRRALGEALAASGVTADRRWPASRSPPSLTHAPGNGAADRRPEGRRPATAGSPRARPAPRTSTRSTPRASSAPTTSQRIQSEARTLVTAALGSS